MMRDRRYDDSRAYGGDNRRHWGNSSFRSPSPSRRPPPPLGRFRDRGGHSPPPLLPRSRYHGDVEEERRRGEGGSSRRDYDSRRGERWSRDDDGRRGDHGNTDHGYRRVSYGDTGINRGFDGNFNWQDRRQDRVHDQDFTSGKNRDYDRTFGGRDAEDRGNSRGYDRSFSGGNGGDKGNTRIYDRNFSSGRNDVGNSSHQGDRISSNDYGNGVGLYGSKDRDLDDGQPQRMYQSGGNGGFSWGMHGASEGTSSKFQSDRLLDESKNGYNRTFHDGIGNHRLGSNLNYDYQSSKLFDKSRDGNPILVDSERERVNTSSFYPTNTSFPTALPYSSTSIDHTVSSSRLKGIDPVAHGSFKEDVSGSIRDDLSLPSDSTRLRPGMLTNAMSYVGVGENLGRSPINHDGRHGDYKSYSQPYLVTAKENHRDYNYPLDDSGVARKFPTEMYRKSLLGGEESNLQNSSRLVARDPVGDKPSASSHGGYLRGSELLDHHSTSHGFSIADGDDAYQSFNTRRKVVEDQQYEDLEQPNYGRELYRGPKSSLVGEPKHADEVACSPRFQRGRSDVLPPREYDPHIGDTDGHSNDEFIRNAQFSKPSSLLKRKHAGSEFLDPRNTNYGPSETGELWSNSGDPVMPSRRSRFGNSKYVKSQRSFDMVEHHHSASGTISITSSSRLRSGLSGARDIKKRLGPVSHKLHVSQRLVKKCTRPLKKRLGPAPKKNHITLPWLKNLNAPSIPVNEEKSGESACPQEEHSAEDNDSPLKPEPPENSEDFKQLVKSAFYKFVKQLNETPGKKRKYKEQGPGGCLKCVVCRSQEEFVSTESLATHALTCQERGLRSQHLGFHKALCALMGWKFGSIQDCAWSCEKLSDMENKALKEDLILWPPVVIIHNNTIGIVNPDQQVVVTTEELEAKLRDMGFGDKAKVYRGKPANQSVMVVEFAGTLSGLQEAERLHKVFAEKKHGRADFLEFRSTSNQTNGSEAESEVVNKLDSVLYGYWGIAEDLDKLDFDAKKRRLVKSKKEITDIAEAPIKT